jgi:cobyrinic acid a,c-diamide synthase
VSSVPRVVIAAPASGHGKTTVATGLIAALTARGRRVSPHKVGPDYIDPGYHALAAGRPGRNLDPYLVGEGRIAPLFAHGARGADVAVIEGVMGLYDGAFGMGEFASTAHVAKLLAAPVVLVVDARSQGRSVAALVQGFLAYDPSAHIGGVIFNRVGSDRHEQILREAIEGFGLPVLGVLRRDERIDTPSRHLGLVPVAERLPAAAAVIGALGDLIAASVDLGAVEALACSAPALPGGRAWQARAEIDEPVPGRPCIAVATGAAFTFGYAETTELLAAAGAEVAAIDPLRNEVLPEGTRGLVIGGGFPEVYAAELSANEGLRRHVAAFAGAGGVITAECAGLLYLARTLDDIPMCGVLPANARMTSRLALGYRHAVATRDSVIARAGQRVRGHEFHRTVVVPRATGQGAWQWGPEGPEGFVTGNIHASYLHVHPAGHPDVVARFVRACAVAPVDRRLRRRR